jgi:polyadenylate-binding protein 2
MTDSDSPFVINSDATGGQDSELEELQRQVLDLQEDLHVKQAQDAAAKEEGQRKSVGGGANAVAKSTSVFVGGCDPKTSENDLKLFFAGCGTISRITILKDRYTGAPRGNCYVEFETEEGMNNAVTKDGQTCHGRPLKVAVKRDTPAPGTVPRGGAQGITGQALQAMMRGGRGRGGPAAMQQQMMAGMMMMMGAGGMPFSPFGAPRGRGGGRGRGRPY